jgi:glycogen phosphorylase
VVRSLVDSDHYQLLADYADYVATQGKVDDCYRDQQDWARRCVLNVAGMGMFSSDRTIQEYASEIWKVAPLAFSDKKAPPSP